MRKPEFYLLVFALLFVVAACGSPQQDDTGTTTEDSTATEETSEAVLAPEDKELHERAVQFFQALPNRVESENNPLTEEKIELGRMLYFDTRLSESNVFSCNSCHNLATYGVDNNPVSIGHQWQLGTRNSPTVFNAALQTSQFWDGRSPDVEDQAKGPILNPIEMGIASEDVAVQRIAAIPEYVEKFQEAFPDAETPVTYDNIVMAIGAFERTLMTPSGFDDFLNGDSNGLTAEAKEGLKVFMDVNCTMCHTGANLGGTMFHKFGLVKGPYWDYINSDSRDEGRFEFTENEGDKYFFKVPILRNITRTYPYFHDGSVYDLAKAIEIMAVTQLGKELTAEETASLMAFMESLTGEIPDEMLQLPVLPPSPSLAK